MLKRAGRNVEWRVIHDGIKTHSTMYGHCVNAIHIKYLAHSATNIPTMPYISTETLIGGALLIVLAVGYQYIPQTSSDQVKAKAKINKKKPKKKGKTSTGSGDEEGEDKVELEEETKKGKGKRKGNFSSADTSSSRTTTGTPEGSTANQPSSFAAAVTSGVGEKSQAPISSKPKTLAQKIAPQPRTTRVDE
jgi:hypothetical protein